MKISVVIPAYNEEKYIRECLDSLVKQNFKNYEIIVSLNNCTDNTKEIVEEFRDIKLIEVNKKGVTNARQVGTLRAEGDIIASADADSVYPEDWLSKIASNFQDNKEIVGLYGPVRLKSDSLFLKFMARYIYTIFLYASELLRNQNVAGINFAFRKNIFDKVGGYTLDLKSAEDIDLAEKIRKFGKIKFDSKLIVYTSDRKFKGRFFKSLLHHGKNYIRVFILKKKPEDMVDIR
ncbi:MAG: glycosyltransferase [Parcubacteria group bacterium]|nr:glycosyltransferase [Parcubacteria group bacterium]